MSNKKQNAIYSIYGINNCLELLEFKKNKILKIYLIHDGQAYKNSNIRRNILEIKNQCVFIDKKEFNKKFPNIRSQGIVIQFQFNLNKLLPTFENKNISLLLPESIEDPQNLGQIIRTSECAGIDGILLPQNRSVGVTNAVLQVSQGAFLHLPIYMIGNISQTLSMLKKEGFWIIGVENGLDASDWYDLDYSGKIVFVFGSEGRGIRPNTLKQCDSIATIPMLGKTNSLNVSAAVSAILFERNRQLVSKVK
tara:strand:- start:19 stop:771 length:753 start_codon:yes stop_codon:yes gene_type:complete